MIPAIGTTICIYVVTQMVALGTRKGDRAESTAARIMAILTILVAVTSAIAINQASSSVPKF